MRILIVAAAIAALLPTDAVGQATTTRWQAEPLALTMLAETVVPQAVSLEAAALLEADAARMPAWLKWGLIGGAGTAAVAALLSQASIDVDPPGAGESALRGFAIGFVTIGGGVAVWQLVCREGGWSRRNGLCEPGPRRR